MWDAVLRVPFITSEVCREPFPYSTCGLLLRVRRGETRFCGGQRPCPVGTMQYCKDMEPVSPPLVPLMINL